MTADDHLAAAQRILSAAPPDETPGQAGARRVEAGIEFQLALIAYAQEERDAMAQVMAAVAHSDARHSAVLDRMEDALAHIAPRRRGWRGWLTGDDGREGA